MVLFSSESNLKFLCYALVSTVENIFFIILHKNITQRYFLSPKIIFDGSQSHLPTPETKYHPLLIFPAMDSRKGLKKITERKSCSVLKRKIIKMNYTIRIS